MEVAQQLVLEVLVLSSRYELDLSTNKLIFYESQERTEKISGCRKDCNLFLARSQEEAAVAAVAALLLTLRAEAVFAALLLTLKAEAVVGSLIG